MNGKTVKVLRKWARIKGFTEKSVKTMWTVFSPSQKKQAKRFIKHVVSATSAAEAAKGTILRATAQA